MARKPSGKHSHRNEPMGGRSAGEGAWERRPRAHCQATRAGSHLGRRPVAGRSTQRPIWHLEDVTRPDEGRGGEGRKWTGRLYTKSTRFGLLNQAQKPVADFYVPQHPQQENCPQPPTKWDTWSRGKKES